MSNQISREAVFATIVDFRLNTLSVSELKNMTAEYDDSDSFRDNVFECVRYEFLGVTNTYLSDFYASLTGQKVDVIGKVDERLPCPCCGYCTLSERYCIEQGTGYDICRYCWWEDDGTSDTYAFSGVNQGTIAEYRKKSPKVDKFLQIRAT